MPPAFLITAQKHTLSSTQNESIWVSNVPVKQYPFSRFMCVIWKKHNESKPTQLIVFAQPPFKGWMMPISKFVTVYRVVYEELQPRLLDCKEVDKHTLCGLTVPFRPNNLQAVISRNAIMTAPNDFALDKKKCPLQQLLYLPRALKVNFYKSCVCIKKESRTLFSKKNRGWGILSLSQPTFRAMNRSNTSYIIMMFGYLCSDGMPFY